MWSRFRVARRSPVRSSRDAVDEVVGVLVPWFDASLQLSRRFRFAADRVDIHDAVAGAGFHRVVGRLHVHPECSVQAEGDNMVTLQRQGTRVRLIAEGGSLSVEPAASSGSRYALQAGNLVANPVVAVTYEGELPMQWQLVLQIA